MRFTPVPSPLRPGPVPARREGRILPALQLRPEFISGLRSPETGPDPVGNSDITAHARAIVIPSFSSGL